MSLVTPVAQMRKLSIYAQKTSTTQSRSLPTVGDTTIMTEEARRIKEIVQDTIREQFAQGRAALRSNLGLPAQELTTSQDRAIAGTSLNIGPTPVAESSNRKCVLNCSGGKFSTSVQFWIPRTSSTCQSVCSAFCIWFAWICNCCVEAKGASVLLWPKH